MTILTARPVTRAAAFDSNWADVRKFQNSSFVNVYILPYMSLLHV